jgi:hypothetical protein
MLALLEGKHNMDDFQIKCSGEFRRKILREENKQDPINNNLDTINGIDYIEVRKVVKSVVSQNNMSNADSASNTRLNISPTEKTSIILLLFLFKEPPLNVIDKENIIILGGTRIQNIGIELAGKIEEILKDLDEKEKEVINKLDISKKKNLIVIKPKQEGDFSVYKLKLIEKRKPDEILSNFDPIFSQIDFSFKIDCALDFDCKKNDKICPPITFQEPLLDYMAKDYASFVKLILSRFSHIIPDWREKSPADLTNVLIELLSYVGDHLSYYQDAVSTEAYLGTAKKRISIRRHARLLDYFIHEGSNARTWVCFKIDPNEDQEHEHNGVILKKSTKLLTGKSTKDKNYQIVSENDFVEIVSQKEVQVFETAHEVKLFSSLNEILFYTWGETNCCLPKGATHATLLARNEVNGSVKYDLDLYIFSWETIFDIQSDQNNLKGFILRISSIFRNRNSLNIIKINDNYIKLVDNENQLRFISIELSNNKENALAKDNNDYCVYEFVAKKLDNKTQIYGLSLNAGDVLLLEEIKSPTTLKEADKNFSHRQAIKLRNVKRKIDPINKANLVEIYWEKQDALKFPLCINVVNPNTSAASAENNINNNISDNLNIISVASGNVVLVDHGYTIKNEELEDVPRSGIFYPKLEKKAITFASLFIPSLSAYSCIYSTQNIEEVYPVIKVREGPANKILHNDDNHEEDIEINRWWPKRDLLSSDRFAKEFVVEIDNDGVAYLRFGDGKNGQKPQNKLDEGDANEPVKFFASYRVGNGRIGNVGSETITRIVKNVDNKNIIGRIQSLRNPLPAIGGTEPESLNEIRQNAPVTFRKRKERAVTEEDYVSVLRRHPEVQKAVVMFRWTGSWYTVYIIIDRIEGKIVDDVFKQEIYSFLNKFRLAGYDLKIISPNFVPLDIQINVCVKPNHYPEKVKKTLLDIFSTNVLGDGYIGFFHPDNFTFGQPLYLSKIYHTIMNVEGVKSVFVKRFQRMGKSKNMELEKGMIQVHASEIIRVDNDPSFSDNGKIDFVMEGGI